MVPQEPAHQQGPLEIAAREKLSHVRHMDEDERWALSRRLMHDDLAVEDRFAGLLVLLYAQSLTTVCQLPVTAVIVADSQTSLMLGDSPLLLPDPLDKLARRLLARRRGHVTIGASSDSPWLFPGAFAGQGGGNGAAEPAAAGKHQRGPALNPKIHKCPRFPCRGISNSADLDAGG